MSGTRIELHRPGGHLSETVSREGGSQEGAFDPSVLRAKYLDYCSARVAEVLLRLSADEMYVLAEAAAREAGLEDAQALSYDRIVRLATERLSRQISLPPFETWVKAYREDPEHFERELLGLWESDLEASGQSGPTPE